MRWDGSCHVGSSVGPQQLWGNRVLLTTEGVWSEGVWSGGSPIHHVSSAITHSDVTLYLPRAWRKTIKCELRWVEHAWHDGEVVHSSIYVIHCCFLLC